MRSHSYLKVTDEILEKLKFIQDHISDRVSKTEILNVLLDMSIRIATNDFRGTDWQKCLEPYQSIKMGPSEKKNQ